MQPRVEAGAAERPLVDDRDPQAACSGGRRYLEPGAGADDDEVEAIVHTGIMRAPAIGWLTFLPGPD
jgi:hypothetical protein